MVPKRCSGIHPMILKDKELDPNVKTVTIPSIENNIITYLTITPVRMHFICLILKQFMALQ